jgi:hypothetical protein
MNNKVTIESNITLAEETFSIYDIDNEFLEIPCFRKGCEVRDMFTLIYDFVIENRNNEFEDHELEYMEIIGELYEYSNSMEPEVIMECYGIVTDENDVDYNKEECKLFFKSLKVFYKKIQTTVKDYYNEDSFS